jgi:adenylylsulfate kinase
VLKAMNYRAVIMGLDFSTINLFTGTVRVALGFMLASNVYTTAAYLAHERPWSRVKWGITEGA